MAPVSGKKPFFFVFTWDLVPREKPSEHQYNTILVERVGRVGIITLNRPKALNALCGELTTEMLDQLVKFDADINIGAVIITGGSKVFAAGADIKEFEGKGMVDLMNKDSLNWTLGFKNIRKPIIAVVNGYALGGGCELAMMCDMIYAGESAVFGQPEIKLGIIPGAGGTQRLVKAVGKSKAMEICLTGTVNMKAQEALQFGLVSSVHPVEKVMQAALKTATIIASQSQPVISLIKASINNSFEVPLQAGLDYERKAIQMAFGTKDKIEGVKAFIEKRKPLFSHL
ncbi:putative enoyl-CoA hydratase, mitochondrial [Zancudomyces culisetae]|uniref:Putative enoyl-CoA hydratase, mitochondrial n=1 Tax=Zancudomyces culisetae TaxID=1213189 RepID=A0A1R1PMZ1_ZANCU|nr:putative enoyl-CoA hydratase, mitochondrial [Zancudomyces culisetae]OMH82327.1 putative enoyl-CoA hydratase, mitochondrial [Zancudomyces culisetae]|eukprot:OMH79872.1 putative enoyl-CoA hydratase, mitochondrial [Zancudomyces culisetae]